MTTRGLPLRLRTGAVTVLLGDAAARQRLLTDLDEQTARCHGGHDLPGVVRLRFDLAVPAQERARAVADREGLTVLLADRPTSGLDDAGRRSVLQALRTVAAGRRRAGRRPSPVAARRWPTPRCGSARPAAGGRDLRSPARWPRRSGSRRRRHPRRRAPTPGALQLLVEPALGAVTGTDQPGALGPARNAISTNVPQWAWSPATVMAPAWQSTRRCTRSWRPSSPGRAGSVEAVVMGVLRGSGDGRACDAWCPVRRRLSPKVRLPSPSAGAQS